MSENITSERPDPEHITAPTSTAEAAFRESGELFFHGSLDQPLRLIPARERVEYAAQSLGNRLLSGAANIQIETDAEGKEIVRALYDGFLLDLVCLIYLCVCPASDVMLAHRKPGEVISRAQAWADKHGIGPGGEHFDEAVGLYWAIFEQINASRFRLQKARAEGKPKSGNA